MRCGAFHSFNLSEKQMWCSSDKVDRSPKPVQDSRLFGVVRPDGLVGFQCGRPDNGGRSPYPLQGCAPAPATRGMFIGADGPRPAVGKKPLPERPPRSCIPPMLPRLRCVPIPLVLERLRGGILPKGESRGLLDSGRRMLRCEGLMPEKGGIPRKDWPSPLHSDDGLREGPCG